MQNIKIKDITNSHRAISAVDGDLVFNQVVASFENKEPVTLDFEGIDLTITAFLNSSIGKLYSKFSTETIRELLDIKNLSQDELPLLKLVIERAKERFGKNYPTDLDRIDVVNED